MCENKNKLCVSVKWGQRCVNTASVFTRHHVTVASAYSCSINVLLWLILSHSHTHLPLNTPPAVSHDTFFHMHKKLWTCWLSIAEMFCETFSETSFTFKTAPKTWTTNCNHSKSALIEWCKLPSSSENVKRFQQTHKKTHSRCDILALRLASLTSISPLIGSEYCRWAK